MDITIHTKIGENDSSYALHMHPTRVLVWTSRYAATINLEIYKEHVVFILAASFEINLELCRQ